MASEIITLHYCLSPDRYYLYLDTGVFIFISSRTNKSEENNRRSVDYIRSLSFSCQVINNASRSNLSTKRVDYIEHRIVKSKKYTEEKKHDPEGKM
jgi:hypothetical protein